MLTGKKNITFDGDQVIETLIPLTDFTTPFLQGQRGLPGEQGFKGLPGPVVSNTLSPR